MRVVDAIHNLAINHKVGLTPPGAQNATYVLISAFDKSESDVILWVDRNLVGNRGFHRGSGELNLFLEKVTRGLNLAAIASISHGPALGGESASSDPLSILSLRLAPQPELGDSIIVIRMYLESILVLRYIQVGRDVTPLQIDHKGRHGP